MTFRPCRLTPKSRCVIWAFARSGWDRIQALLDEQIVGRSDELKERGLRRRAARATLDLLARARAQAEEERLAVDGARARGQELARRAAALRLMSSPRPGRAASASIPPA